MWSKNKPRMTPAERAHVEWIKSLPCCVCKEPGPSEAHHVEQDSHYKCVPLCTSCHRDERNGIHGQKVMWKIHKMDEVDAMASVIRELSNARRED
jgi:hypothetical protein